MITETAEACRDGVLSPAEAMELADMRAAQDKGLWGEAMRRRFRILKQREGGGQYFDREHADRTAAGLPWFCR